jgi:hypothetical protein
VTLAALSILWCGVSASAETLRCQSVNGNLNCAGPGGVSCQTVDGNKVCVSGHGDVVQSFGNSQSSGNIQSFGGSATRDDSMGDGEGLDDAPPVPVVKQRLEQRDARGRTLLLEREGTKLHLRSDRLSIDRE